MIRALVLAAGLVGAAAGAAWAQDIFALIVTRTVLGEMKPEVTVRSLYVVPVPAHQTPQQACDYTQHYVELAMDRVYELERWNGQIDYHCVRIPQVRMDITEAP